MTPSPRRSRRAVLAVDTNLLVRYFVVDDPAQSERVRALFTNNRIWIAKTVLLETDWVLRRSFGFPPARVASTFRALMETDSVQLEKANEVDEALNLCAAGVSFADAMHVASADGATAFMSFDEPLIRRAAGRASVSVKSAAARA